MTTKRKHSTSKSASLKDPAKPAFVLRPRPNRLMASNEFLLVCDVFCPDQAPRHFTLATTKLDNQFHTIEDIEDDLRIFPFFKPQLSIRVQNLPSCVFPTLKRKLRYLSEADWNPQAHHLFSIFPSSDFERRSKDMAAWPDNRFLTPKQQTREPDTSPPRIRHVVTPCVYDEEGSMGTANLPFLSSSM